MPKREDLLECLMLEIRSEYANVAGADTAPIMFCNSYGFRDENITRIYVRIVVTCSPLPSVATNRATGCSEIQRRRVNTYSSFCCLIMTKNLKLTEKIFI
jgi:hypothetical protein